LNPPAEPYVSPLKDIGGELPVKAERSEGHWGRDPIDRVPWVGGQRRKQNTQFAINILKDGDPIVS